MSTEISEKDWGKLRRAIEFNDAEMFADLVADLAAIAVRNEIARRAERRRPAYINGKPFFIMDRN